MTVTESTTRTLEAPGATLTYDVRPGGSTDELPLFLIGSPMGAAGFGTLSGLLPGSHAHHLRPARVRAEHQAGHDVAVHAGRARR